MATEQQKSGARLQSGSALAAEELYREHHEHIFRFIWSRVHDAEQAEDLTGEVFIRMVANLADYRDRSLPFRAWLYQIARNLIIDHHRKESSSRTMEATVPQHPDHKSPEEKVEATLTLERVQRALEKIDPTQREVMELRFLAELPLKDVALTMNKSVSAVKALQHRGLASLRAQLQE